MNSIASGLVMVQRLFCCCSPSRVDQTSMRFSYNKLWKLLIDKNMNKQTLKKISNVSSASMAKLGKRQNVTTDVLLRICTALGCEVGDIMEIVPDEKQTEELEEAPHG